MTELAALNVKITGDASGLKAATSASQTSLSNLGKTAESAANKSSTAFNKVGTAAAGMGGKVEGALSRSTGSIRTYSSQIDSARGHTGNLAAQFNDIGVMLASGQSPLLLAVQQGTQVNQVLNQIGTTGRARLAALGTAFTSLINPANLATFAIIAGGAALIQWGMAAVGAGADTLSFEETLDQANSSLKELQELTALVSGNGLEKLREKYGEVNTELLNFIALQHQIAQQKAMEDAAAALSALMDEMSGFEGAATNINQLFDDFGTKATQGLGQVAIAMREATDAKGLQAQLAATVNLRSAIERATGGLQNMSAEQLGFYNKVVQSENALRMVTAEVHKGWGAMETLGSTASAAAGGVDEITAAAQRGVSALWGMAQAIGAAYQAAYSFKPTANMAAEDLAMGQSLTADPSAAARASALGVGAAFDFANPSGGGGGGGQDQTEKDLEQLRKTFMTAEQIQLDSFTRQQETLQSALEQKLITQEEYNALMEQAQQAHSDRMSQIDAFRYGDGLQKAGAFFGAMADALQGGNEKMLKISKAFGAAEALINAYRAYQQTVADPSLPWYAKLAAGAKVLAAGMQAVNAIKGVGKGGGGGARPSGGGSEASAGGGQQSGTYVNVSLTGGNMFGADQVRNLISEINKQIENGSVIKGIRAT